METDKYNLSDRTYANVLNNVCAELQRQGITYAIVGGAAAQILIADAVGWKKSELEIRLRKTKDIDVSLKVNDSDEFNATYFFNSLHAEQVLPGHASVKGVKVNYTTTPNQFKGFRDFYFSFIEQSIQVKHPKTGMVYNVIKPEHLIVTKLTRKGRQEKDIIDIAALLNAFSISGRTIDDGEVRGILKTLGKAEMLESYKRIKDSV